MEAYAVDQVDIARQSLRISKLQAQTSGDGWELDLGNAKFASQTNTKAKMSHYVFFFIDFSQYMSSSCCCPVYSSCANSGTLLNRECIHMKPAFVSQSHQRK